MKKSNEKNPINHTDSLLNMLVDDILDASDEDILEELRAEGLNLCDVAKNASGLVQNVVYEHNQNALEEARAAMLFNKQSTQPSLRVSDMKMKRAILKTLNANDNGVTLAARKEADLSDRDVDSLLHNMLELGIIDEDGNIL